MRLEAVVELHEAVAEAGDAESGSREGITMQS